MNNEENVEIVKITIMMMITNLKDRTNQSKSIRIVISSLIHSLTHSFISLPTFTVHILTRGMSTNNSWTKSPFPRIFRVLLLGGSTTWNR